VKADAGLDACTRCGLCLQACPTYRVLGLEADSPRGRVFLMKRAAEGDTGVEAALAEHLYVCLGCRACETACPSGVPFGRLLEEGRLHVETRPAPAPGRTGWRLFRRIAFEWVLPRRWLFDAAMAPARLLQRFPWLLRVLARAPLPQRMRAYIAMIPQLPARVFRLPAVSAAKGARRGRVGVFVGCVMGALFPGVHASLARVLRHNGCDVVNPQGQWCCGALNVHAGERTHALAMARRNVDAFDDDGLEAIVVDSAGCSAHLKSYGELLVDDPAYAARAKSFASKVKDVAEFLCEIGPRADLGPMPLRATYLDACHLLHGQRVREQPRTLLSSIPGFELVEMADAGRCCGAAGVYSLTHPVMSSRILAGTMERIAATGAQTVIVANPGCHMQVLGCAAASAPGLRVRHLVEVLDEAYARSYLI
jgi:glycolate oxidase iron-sulfur subunit